MDPSVYIPAYLERTYLASHPELTDAARELVHNDISANPHKYAQSEHAQALLSYAGVHRHLLDELHRIEDMGSDEEFEQTRNRLFDDMRDELLKIVRVDALAVDAQLLAIILADTPVDACLGDLMKLEASTADYLQQSVPGFDMEAPHYWANNVLADGVTAADLTVSHPGRRHRIACPRPLGRPGRLFCPGASARGADGGRRTRKLCLVPARPHDSAV